MWWGGDVNVRLKLNTPLLLRWACGGVEMWTLGWSWTRLCCYADHVVGWRCERSVEVEHASAATLIMGWGGVGMLTFVCSWTRHACYAEHVVGWRCERSVEVEHASAATLIMWWGGDVNVRLKLNTPLLLRWSWGGVGWGGDVNVRLQLNTPRMLRWACGGVEMWTFGWSWARLCCYADHVVGWRCERSVEVEHASAATLIMGWGGDVNVRLQLNTPRMLRWACVGVEMWTFGWSWTRLCCYADHVVGWRCERSVEVEHASAATLIMGWGGVGMLTFVCSWTRHACYAEHVVGWREMWTFGWSWTRLCCYADHVVGWRCERSVEVEHASAATLIMGWGGVGMLTFVCSWTRHACYAEHVLGWRCERSVEVEHASAATLTSWKKPQRSTCTMINESGKAKKVRNLCCKGCKIQEKWPFWGTFFSWSEGHETLKGLSFLSACWCAYTRDSAPGGMYNYRFHTSYLSTSKND